MFLLGVCCVYVSTLKIGNDIPVYTFTIHIFKHRHPRLDRGDLHRLQHSHSRLDRESQSHCVISRAIIDTKLAKYTVEFIGHSVIFPPKNVTEVNT